MPRKPSFNFGANVRPKKNRHTRKKSRKGSKGRSGNNAWRAYISNAPIPD